MKPRMDLCLPTFNECEDIEFSEDFQRIDGLINSYDSDGHAPLRKGEKPFQWGAIESMSRNLLEKCPDLRVTIWLLRANLMANTLFEVTESIGLLAGLMRLPANSIFPQAGDDEATREVHMIPLAWLAREQFFHCLQSVNIWKDREVSLNDLMTASDLNTVFKTRSMNDVNEAIESIRNSLCFILNALNEEGDLAPYDFSKTTYYLERITAKLSAWPSEGQAGCVSEKTESYAEQLVPVTRTREEIRKQLDDLIQYFRTNEPGHPAPIFLLRVQKMVGASFEELMAELYPDASQLVARLEGPQVTA